MDKNLMVDIMMVDELEFLRTDKILKCSMCLADIYTLLTVKNYSLDRLLEINRVRNKKSCYYKEDIFIFKEKNIKKLEQVYKPLKGIQTEESFEKVIKRVIDFSMLYYKELTKRENDNYIWNKDKMGWEEECKII